MKRIPLPPTLLGKSYQAGLREKAQFSRVLPFFSQSTIVPSLMITGIRLISRVYCLITLPVADGGSGTLPVADGGSGRIRMTPAN
jgi:hypothetical protein